MHKNQCHGIYCTQCGLNDWNLNPQFGSKGMARIMEDIAHDIKEAAYYHSGIDDQPGKIGE